MVVHAGVCLDGLHHGVAQNVGKGDLATTSAFELIVNGGAVLEHEARGHIAYRRRRRDF